jgi:ectoine hydroxylase-related dioxygenase (phytanoyl-CoA dioxygenase family)
MDIVENIKNDGFVVLRNFLSESEAESIKDEIIKSFIKVEDTCYATTENNQTTNGAKGENPQGKNLRIMPSSYEQIPNIKKYIFNNQLLNDTISNYYTAHCKRFLQVFTSWEDKVVDKNSVARYGWLHSDPYASLKIAIFPLGATKTTGALKVIPGSREEGKIIRERFMSLGPKGIQGGVAHRMVDFKQQCPDLITRNEDEAIDVEVSNLDLVILDTDTYHAGGELIDEKSQRIAVYIHNRP